MSTLQIFTDQNANDALLVTSEVARIATALNEVGVRFEQWQTTADILPGADSESVINAYQQDIDRLIAEKGYQTVDVVSLNSDHPDKALLRQKFLSEHTHSEDEVRFFVAGQGLFTLHIAGKIYEVLCTQGDLISVPANTPHWFDMGEYPNFVAIRLFDNPEGWVATFTGSEIAEKFSRFEEVAATR